MDQKLFWAARSGDVSFLSKEDIKTRHLLSQLTPTGSSVLHIAVECDQFEFFKEAARLCSPSLVKHANYKGETPFHSAVRGGSTEVVEFIIEHAERLLSDIEQGHDVEGYKELLRIENTNGDNALHLAARHNLKSDVAKLLLEADPELSTVVNSKSQQSACFIALSKANTRVADELLSSRNPSCSLRGQINGMTALHAAILGRLSKFEDLDLMRKLVEAAPEMINQGDDIGWTPLHYAASNLGNSDIVRLFLEKDKSAAFKLDLHDGRSALHIAAIQGDVYLMEVLIETCPGCADLVDNRGRNALHAAVLARQERSVTYLVSLPGATLFTEADQDGNTPLRLTVLRNDERIIRVFVPEEATNNEKPKDSGKSFLDKELRYVRFDMQNWQEKAVQLVQDALIMDNNDSSSSSSKDGVVDDDYGYYQFSATLIATVTFTAAFTLPGGFIQSGGKDEGMTVLVSKPAFQAFVIFDVLAFFASLAIFILLLFYKHAEETGSSTYKIGKVVMIYLSISYYGMALAFCCGLYVVLGNTSAFSIVVLVLSLLCTLVAIFGSLAIGFPDVVTLILEGIHERRQEYKSRKEEEREREAHMKDELRSRLEERNLTLLEM